MAQKSEKPKLLLAYAIFCLEGTSILRPHIQSKLRSEAAEILKNLSRKGLVEAQYHLGKLYESERMDKLAYWQYKQGSRKSYPPSCCALARCYESGRGTSVSVRKAVRYYLLAATGGDASAMYRLGTCYLLGELEVEVDEDEGVKWLKRATTGLMFLFYFVYFACIFGTNV
jgi:TPR repeat protein